MYVGTAIADINDVIRADLRARLELFEDKDFAIARIGAGNGIDFAGLGIKEFRAENVVGGNNAFKGRLYHFNRRGRQNVKIEMIPRNAAVKNLIEQRDIFLQANAFADFIKMLFAHAQLELGIVQKQVGKSSALLHQIQPGHTSRRAFKLGRGNADQLGENVAGVVEGQRLIEVAGENIFLA